MTAVGENVWGQKSRITGPPSHFENKLFRGSMRTATWITFMRDDHFPNERLDTDSQFTAAIRGICALDRHEMARDAATGRLVPS